MTSGDYLEKSRKYYNSRFGTPDEQPVGLSDDEIVRWKVIQSTLEKNLQKFQDREVRILDFGCGRGWISQLLSSYGSVTGVDLAEDAIKYASLQYPGIEFICLDASSPESSPLKNRQFDIVISSEVIEHITEQSSYISNIASYINSGGILILTTPNGKWIKEWFSGKRNEYRQPFELWLTREELIDLCEPYFSPIRISSFYSDWLFLNKTNVISPLLVSLLSMRIALKAGFFRFWYKKLNKRNFGLYLILSATKK